MLFFLRYLFLRVGRRFLVLVQSFRKRISEGFAFRATERDVGYENSFAS